jgi:hypothetical protein
MRIAIASIVAAALALASSADAAPSNKKKQRYTATKEKVQPPPRNGPRPFGYDASPEHYRVGSSAWWKAMEREGRGGFGDTP